MNRAEILDTAKMLTCGDRDKDYGSPVDNMTDIAEMWSVILDQPVRPEHVALCMVAVKLCRAKVSPEKADHYADGAAYMGIAGECCNAR